MRPPTAEEIATAATMQGDPIAANSRAVRACRPAGLHKRSTGRPRKDGQPPHRTAAALAKERAAAAAAVYAATNATPPAAADRQRGEGAPAAFVTPDLQSRLRHFCEKCQNARARTFLEAYAKGGHRAAVLASGVGAVELMGLKNNDEFRRLHEELRQAHDAATVARTCDTLADLANGEYKPRPNCLPPDMRAASLLMPALDARFRAGQQGAAQQVQINISI